MVTGTESDVFYANKTYMGRIIGTRGVTINDLQSRSGCDIQVDQKVAPGQDCPITIKGARQGIEMVKNMLREIIEMGPNHPYAGGGLPQFGATPGYQQSQGGYNSGQAGQQQYGAYGGGGGGGQYQAPMQQQSQMYNGAPQQQYYPQQQPQQSYGGSSYQQPNSYVQQQAPPPPPPPPPQASGWKAAAAADGQTYYYNEQTGETQWSKPVGMP